MPRRHCCDPSLAVAALGGKPDRLLKDLEWLGLLFELLVIRDLRVLAQALDGEVFHHRDNYGAEVKLGRGQVEAAVAGLLRFRRQIDTSRTGEPAFLAVVCGSGMATDARMALWCRWGRWGREALGRAG